MSLRRRYIVQFSGGFAQRLQRVTGVLLLLYLLLHVRTIHQLREGPQAFEAALATFKHPVFKLLEIALLGTVILHSMNGVRVTLLDLGLANEKRRQFGLALTAGISVVIFLIGAIPIFLHAVLRK